MASVGLLEDNARIAKLCSTFLHFAGHQVTVYETSQECLQALLSENKRSDGCSAFHENTSASSLPVEVLIMVRWPKLCVWLLMLLSSKNPLSYKRLSLQSRMPCRLLHNNL